MAPGPDQTDGSTPGAAEQLAAEHALAQLKSDEVRTGFGGLMPLESEKAKALRESGTKSKKRITTSDGSVTDEDEEDTTSQAGAKEPPAKRQKTEEPPPPTGGYLGFLGRTLRQTPARGAANDAARKKGATDPRKKKKDAKGRNPKQPPNDMRAASPQSGANPAASTTKGSPSTENGDKGPGPKQQPPNDTRAASPQSGANPAASTTKGSPSAKNSEEGPGPKVSQNNTSTAQPQSAANPAAQTTKGGPSAKNGEKGTGPKVSPNNTSTAQPQSAANPAATVGSGGPPAEKTQAEETLVAKVVHPPTTNQVPSGLVPGVDTPLSPTPSTPQSLVTGNQKPEEPKGPNGSKINRAKEPDSHQAGGKKVGSKEPGSRQSGGKKIDRQPQTPSRPPMNGFEAADRLTAENGGYIASDEDSDSPLRELVLPPMYDPRNDFKRRSNKGGSPRRSQRIRRQSATGLGSDDQELEENGDTGDQGNGLVEDSVAGDQGGSLQEELDKEGDMRGAPVYRLTGTRRAPANNNKKRIPGLQFPPNKNFVPQPFVQVGGKTLSNSQLNANLTFEQGVPRANICVACLGALSSYNSEFSVGRGVKSHVELCSCFVHAAYGNKGKQCGRCQVLAKGKEECIDPPPEIQQATQEFLPHVVRFNELYVKYPNLTWATMNDAQRVFAKDFSAKAKAWNSLWMAVRRGSEYVTPKKKSMSDLGEMMTHLSEVVKQGFEDVRKDVQDLKKQVEEYGRKQEHYGLASMDGVRIARQSRARLRHMVDSFDQIGDHMGPNTDGDKFPSKKFDLFNADCQSEGEVEEDPYVHGADLRFANRALGPAPDL